MSNSERKQKTKAFRRSWHVWAGRKLPTHRPHMRAIYICRAVEAGSRLFLMEMTAICLSPQTPAYIPTSVWRRTLLPPRPRLSEERSLITFPSVTLTREGAKAKPSYAQKSGDFTFAPRILPQGGGITLPLNVRTRDGEGSWQLLNPCSSGGSSLQPQGHIKT